ncbi:MAG TPA: D-aminoacylase [Desulfobacterales bacterium]|nr:D-aminoacylase [Desulfobacterales bacterium]
MKFDLIIRNATVVDGRGAPAFEADVALADGRIASVGVPADAWAVEELEAAGMVLCPGFIDSHSHADLSLLTQGLEDEKLRMGVTTEIIGQCGYSAFPVDDRHRGLRADTMSGFLPGIRLPWDWSTLDDYRAACTRIGLTHNIVSLAGHGSIRVAVMGDRAEAPKAGELDRMRHLVRQAMEMGAFGLSTGLIYPPACYAEPSEIEALCRVVAEFGGVHVTHVRGETADLVDAAVEEALEISFASGVALQISHLKVIGLHRRNRGKVKSVIARIEAARRAGLEVNFDCYPYTEGSTLLSTLVPRWAQVQGVSGLVARLGNPEDRAKIRRDIETDTPGWENWANACGLDAVKIAALNRGRSDPIVGMDLAAVGRLRGTDPIEALFDIIVAEQANAMMVFSMMTEEDMLTALCHPLGMIGTDAIPCPPGQGRPHPRGYGAFPRILGRLVRGTGVIALEEAVRKMTSLPAQKFGLRDRGHVAVGMHADLVIFDPSRIIDQATYEAPRRPPSGIKAVIVNGRPMLSGAIVSPHRPGMFLEPSKQETA